MIFNTVCAIWKFVVFMTSIYEEPSQISVNFRMFDPGKPTFIEFALNNYTEVTLNSSKTYIILAHGWEDGFDSILYGNVTKEFSSHEDIIVITSGYENSMRQSYCVAISYIEEIGKRIGNLVTDLISFEIPVDHIELVGHSLGAHIVGIAGQYVYTKAGVKIKRIFGLDPASPSIPYHTNLFSQNKLQLTKDDAERVVIIHTSVLGLQKSIGHVDFYPNGGYFQGNCRYLHESNHVTANYYFYSSINYQGNYTAHKCSSYCRYLMNKCGTNETALMGYHVEESAYGDYYLDVTC